MSQRDDDDHTEDQYHYHMSVIDDAIARWRKDEISTVRKRQIIADENKRYYGGDRKSPVTGEYISRTPRPYELPGVLAAAFGVPEEAMTSALYERRRASAEYRRILDDGGSLEEARAASAEGERIYLQILAASGLAAHRRAS